MPNNYYITEHNIIYVQGSVNGKFERKSTKMKATKANIAYVKKNANALLEEMVGKPKRIESFEEFGLSVLIATSRSRSKATQKEVISKFERLIYPYFSKYTIDEIRPMDVEKWQARLLKEYSTSTVKSCRNILSTIMNKAYGNDMIVKNPVLFADKIKVTYTKRESYTLDEARTLMLESDGALKVYLNLAFTTGMRTGELLALKKSDIDYEHKCIILQRSISKGIIRASSSTKNHNRIVWLLPYVFDMLVEFTSSVYGEWIFTPSEKDDRPYYDSKTMLNKQFKPLLKKLKIKDKTLYATRHTFFSISSSENIELQFLQRMAGHAEGSNVTENHYITRSLDERAVKYARESLKPLEDIFGSTK
ncbi:MAG: tyrosine-type recombinase/integrase [Sulfurovaceae bacterium]|nr:tyrosine-type recombinase/integrase [Sulfurovaceae bacterium]